MPQREHLFVFCGKIHANTANILNIMAKTQSEQKNARPARILMISGTKAESAADTLDFTAPPPEQYIRQSITEPIVLRTENTCKLTVHVFGSEVDEQAREIKKNITILDNSVETANIITNPEDESIEETVVLEMVSPDVEIDFNPVQLIKLGALKATKTIGDFLIEGNIITAKDKPSSQSTNYINEPLLKTISNMIENMSTLEHSLSGYENAIEIIEFISTTNPGAQSELGLLTRFNSLVCNHQITQLAMYLSQREHSEPNLTYALNQASLTNASVFVPLMYKNGITTSQTMKMEDTNQYKVVFRQPIPGIAELKKTVTLDLQTKGSVFYYHELNRKMIEEKIFYSAVKLPFYTTKSLEGEIQLLSETNLKQEHLEQKEKLISAHLGAQLKQCLKYLVEQE